MKKKGLFLSLIAAILSVGSLVSCDENTNNNEIVDDGTNNNLNNNENDSKIDDYTVEDNELSRMVYNEFLKSFSDITYEDFKLHGTQFGHNDNISFLYMSSFIETSAGVFVYKKIENNDSYTCSKYINNEWVITDERKYIDGEFKQLYSLELNSDNTFKEKYEYTYDESRKEYTIIKSKYTNDKWEVTYNRTYDYGKSNYKIGIEYESGIPYRKYEIIYDENEKLLNEKISRYVNNSWIEIAEYKYINGICKSSYRITLYAGDVSFCMKEEYEYDENGKSSCYIRSEYKNGEWVYDRKEEYEYSENGQKICTVSKYKNDKWNYDSKNIYVYDGGVLTNEMKYSYVNETWMLSTEYKKINNKWLPSYYISYSNNVPYKYEYIYDENYNRVGCIKSKYTNDEWIYYEKAEYSYSFLVSYTHSLFT